MGIFLTAVISMGILGAFFAAILAVASLKFSVEQDSRITAIEDILPGANCGGCGLPGCSNLAEAIVRGEAPIHACPVAGDEIDAEIASIMGVEAAATKERESAVLLCGGGDGLASKSSLYGGLKNCRGANRIPGGTKDCQFGCLGLGDCAAVCSFDAITMGEDKLPHIDKEKCTACAMCVKACPRSLLMLQPLDQATVVRCKATYPGKRVRSICQVGCIGCRLCVKTCPVEAIDFKENLAVIDFTKCVNCGQCAQKCPTKAITYSRPRIESIAITSDCVGCALCLKKCPVEAITGKVKEVHHIDEEKCIQCGICYEVCRKDAIDVVWIQENS